MSRPGYSWFRQGIARIFLGLSGLAAPASAVLADDAAAPPGVAVLGVPAAVAAVPEGVQVVRFTAPEGVQVEVLSPNPEPAPLGDAQGALTTGLRVGTAYRLRLTNLPGHPSEALYPIVELVGHLHRPPTVDPAQFPIRIPITVEDLDDALDRAQLVTRVVYLEDPDQALPLSLPKGEIPSVTLGPAEDPVKVAAALGRVVAIVRIGGRMPSAEELMVPPYTPVQVAAGPCPFGSPMGGPCALPIGPVCGTPPPPGRLWIPKDEYLCDGGDHKAPAGFAGDGGLRGIDPRDAVIQFARPALPQLQGEFQKLLERFRKGEITYNVYQIESRRLLRSVEGDLRPRVLPTNVVCLYAPRFASVRVVLGPNQALNVQEPYKARQAQRQQIEAARQDPLRLVKNQSAEAQRHRSRASLAVGRDVLRADTEVRVLSSFDRPTILGGIHQIQPTLQLIERQAIGKVRTAEAAVPIKVAEGVVVQGIPQGVGETLMAWKPQETAGVEVPPNQPGVAVLKRVSASVAEPGDRVTFSIQYRNMGNVPIADVAIVDSLLPRFRYIPGTAKGPEGAVFTANENRVGAMELRWDLPGLLAPGAEGWVSFEVEVR